MNTNCIRLVVSTLIMRKVIYSDLTLKESVLKWRSIFYNDILYNNILCCYDELFWIPLENMACFWWYAQTTLYGMMLFSKLIYTSLSKTTKISYLWIDMMVWTVKLSCRISIYMVCCLLFSYNGIIHLLLPPRK